MTNHVFRYSIFGAVSTDEQAIDHDSLANQVRDCRAYAERFGGIETHEPFIADGYSRSFYEGLSEAMAEIPPLREAIHAAEHNEFDVLIVRYFERLGVVAYPVFLRLGKLKKQLRSVQESTPILPPELFDPTKDEATSTMIHLAGLKQDYRINRIINNLRENMPKRIREGLTPSRIPYAYIYQNNKTAPALDSGKASKLIQARDMLMKGESLHKIGKFLGIDRSRVPSVLCNPYYMGQVSYNKSYIQRLGMKRKQIKLPRSKWTTGRGKHQAIFTQAEHEEILAEIERREGVTRRTPDFVFSGLLRCGICGACVRQHWFGNKPKGTKVIVCRVAGAKHVRYDYPDFFDRVARAIQRELERVQNGEADEGEDKSEILRKAIEDGKKKRVKIQQGFEQGVYDAAEASAKLKNLERETERLHRDLERTALDRANRREAGAFMQDLDTSRVPEFLATGDARQINRLLIAWFQEIRVGPDEIELIKR